MNGPLRILTVCAHNRTRSVIAAGLLQVHAQRLGVDVEVDSAGMLDEGQPPTDGAVEILGHVGLDVSDHRSSLVTRDAVFAADLVLTAEADQVVSIAGRWPSAFSRTFTLPELADLARRFGGRGTASVQDWLADMTSHRPATNVYLARDAVPRIVDPTGRDPEVWKQVAAEIDADCAQLIASVA